MWSKHQRGEIIEDNKASSVLEYLQRVFQQGANFWLSLLQVRDAATQKIIEENSPNAYLIPSSDHPHVIAGQGSIALELLEQVPFLDAIVVPVGGGGMLSGICIASKGINPNIKVYAAEPLNADDCAKSFAAKERIRQTGECKLLQAM